MENYLGFVFECHSFRPIETRPIFNRTFIDLYTAGAQCTFFPARLSYSITFVVCLYSNYIYHSHRLSFREGLNNKYTIITIYHARSQYFYHEILMISSKQTIINTWSLQSLTHPEILKSRLSHNPITTTENQNTCSRYIRIAMPMV
jgi:hypothetical protein